MELIKVFLDNLYLEDGSSTDEFAAKALALANDEFLSRVLPSKDMVQELLDLYDSARDYPGVTWPQPLGEDVYKFVNEIEFYKNDNMSRMRG